MGRGLPQEVIGKAKQEVSLDDSFRFECKRCGQCCFRCEIVLTPYDILRLCQGVRITTGEFLDYYGQITLGPESGLPVCWLDFEKVQQWRGGIAAIQGVRDPFHRGHRSGDLRGG